jgi:hypothetical protein
MPVNDFGEKEYYSWAGWKKGLRTAYGEFVVGKNAIFIEGDKDIANAMLLNDNTATKAIHKGKNRNVIGYLGEWDGFTGVVYKEGVTVDV